MRAVADRAREARRAMGGCGYDAGICEKLGWILGLSFGIAIFAQIVCGG